MDIERAMICGHGYGTSIKRKTDKAIWNTMEGNGRLVVDVNIRVAVESATVGSGGMERLSAIIEMLTGHL